MVIASARSGRRAGAVVIASTRCTNVLGSVPMPTSPRLVRTTRIARAAAAAAAFAVALAAAGVRAAEPAADPIRDRRLADAVRVLDSWIGEQMRYHGTPGMAIGLVQGDRVVWSKAYGAADLATGAPVTAATPFRLGSLSKVFTALAVMQLRDDGKLSLDDPVVRHLPWFKVGSAYPDAPPITIRHLLTHTSGLPRELAYPYWTTHTFPDRATFHAALATQSVFSAPGAAYRYSNVGVALLGEIIAAASGEPYAALLQRRLLTPLGMTSSSAAPDAALVARLARAYQRRRGNEPRREIAYYDTGTFAPMGGVVSTVDDLTRLLVLLLSADAGGAVRPADARALAAPTLAEMQRAQFVYPSFAGGRGLGFAVSRRDGATYVGHGGWIGGHRSDLICDMTRRLGVAVLTNADDAPPGPFARRALAMVAEALDGPAKAAAEKTPDPAWARYFGAYTDPWGWEIEVLTLGGELGLYEHDYPPEDDPGDVFNRLVPVPGEPHTFTMGDGERVRFDLAEDGTVKRMLRRSETYLPVKAGDRR
jgi:CubicO group peptidase (beta-lactamase class C family)